MDSIYKMRDRLIAIAKALAMRPILYSLESRFKSQLAEGAGDPVSFTCNICSRENRSPREAVQGRETPSCCHCGSTLRFRSVVRAISLALFDKNLALREFPKAPSLKGVGLTDYWIYAVPLAEKLSYTNTYYHKAPRLDITRSDEISQESVDFFVSSDVFEHVPPPVSRTFDNVFRMLKSGGKLIFTVPISGGEDTQEHFPDLFEYELRKEKGRYTLVNKTRAGDIQVFDGLRFHGGPGSTLEMRCFGRGDLTDILEESGFCNIRFIDDDEPCHGILWGGDISAPIIAEKP